MNGEKVKRFLSGLNLFLPQYAKIELKFTFGWLWHFQDRCYLLSWKLHGDYGLTVGEEPDRELPSLRRICSQYSRNYFDKMYTRTERLLTGSYFHCVDFVLSTVFQTSVMVMKLDFITLFHQMVPFRPSGCQEWRRTRSGWRFWYVKMKVGQVSYRWCT